MIRNNLIVSILILIFICSTISGAAIVSANINQSQTTSTNSGNSVLNDTNLTGNSTNQTTNNQTIDNKTKNKLIKKLAQKVNELNVISSESNETTIAEYSGQKLQELRSEVNNTQMDPKTQKKLFKKIDAALKKNNKSIKSAINGNEKQVNKQLKSEYNILNDIENLLNKEKGKTIAENDTEDLINITDQIKAGHENGAGWILQNNPRLEFKQTSSYYRGIQNKVEEIRNIIAELKAGGVPVEMKVVDASELQLQKDGTYTIKENEISNQTINGTTKVHAFIPVIIIAGVVVVSAAALAVIETKGQIESLEKTKGPICEYCEFNMYCKNIAAAELGTMLTAGVSLLCKEGIELAKIGFKINDLQEPFSTYFIGQLFDRASAVLGDGCDTPGCIFYKYKRTDLTVSLNEPNEAYYKHVTPINVVVTNTKPGNANSFKVTLYENTNLYSGGTMNFAPIATQTISGLSGKSQITVPFNWTPTSLGSHTLKVVVDPDNEVNETVEDNNDDLGVIEVKYHLMKLQLYDTKTRPSTSAPGAYQSIIYYFKAEHPIRLEPSMTPVFIYTTSTPEYNAAGMLPYYPWGSIWQYYSDSQDVNGSWGLCGLYGICGPNQTEYSALHTGYGRGYYQYFAVKMRTQVTDYFPNGIIKTELKDLYVIEYNA